VCRAAGTKDSVCVCVCVCVCVHAYVRVFERAFPSSLEDMNGFADRCSLGFSTLGSSGL
jgi:hypothetical protein